MRDSILLSILDAKDKNEVAPMVGRYLVSERTCSTLPLEPLLRPENCQAAHQAREKQRQTSRLGGLRHRDTVEKGKRRNLKVAIGEEGKHLCRASSVERDAVVLPSGEVMAGKADIGRRCARAGAVEVGRVVVATREGLGARIEIRFSAAAEAYVHRLHGWAAEAGLLRGCIPKADGI